MCNWPAIQLYIDKAERKSENLEKHERYKNTKLQPTYLETAGQGNCAEIFSNYAKKTRDISIYVQAFPRKWLLCTKIQKLNN